MVSSERFRNDLLFRLRYFMIEPPALRERGDDWLLLIEWALDRLACRYGTARQFSDESLRLMEGYRWPGNVRELISVVATGYALAEASRIEPLDFVDRLEHQMSAREDHVAAIHLRLSRGNAGFWQMHGILFQNQTALDRPDLDRYAAPANLNIARYTAIELGLDWFTVYAFSTENWRRNPAEISFLMDFSEWLLHETRVEELRELGVRIRFVGRLDDERIPQRYDGRSQFVRVHHTQWAE